MILDLQKIGAELIETSAKISLVVGRQLVFLMRPNLVEHASEIDQIAHSCRWAANAQLVDCLSILGSQATPSSINLVQLATAADFALDVLYSVRSTNGEPSPGPSRPPLPWGED